MTSESDVPKRLYDAIKILMVLSEGRKRLTDLATIFACAEQVLEEDLERLGWDRLVRKENVEGSETFAISDAGVALLHNWGEIWRKMRV
jgi:predicted transcriptional regulator